MPADKWTVPPADWEISDDLLESLGIERAGLTQPGEVLVYDPQRRVELPTEDPNNE